MCTQRGFFHINSDKVVIANPQQSIDSYFVLLSSVLHGHWYAVYRTHLYLACFEIGHSLRNTTCSLLGDLSCGGIASLFDCEFYTHERSYILRTTLGTSGLVVAEQGCSAKTGFSDFQSCDIPVLNFKNAENNTVGFLLLFSRSALYQDITDLIRMDVN